MTSGMVLVVGPVGIVVVVVVGGVWAPAEPPVAIPMPSATSAAIPAAAGARHGAGSVQRGTRGQAR